MRTCLGRLRVGLATFVALVLLAVVAPPTAAELVGSVSGTVTARGAPLANAWVRIMPVTPTGDWAGQPALTTTDSAGRYTVSDLYAFHVKVEVRAPAFSGLASAYWPQAYSFATAKALRVASSGSVADVDLPGGSTLRGRVVDARTGAPLAGIVTAHVDDQPGSAAVGTSGYSPEPGEFRLEGLPPVPVALRADPPPGGNHLAQWYDGAGFHRAATMIDPGHPAPIVIRLRAGGQVEGTVRAHSGEPVAGAIVTVIGCPDRCPMSAVSDATGVYRLHAVPPGPGLRVFAAVDAVGRDAGLLDGWYPDPDGPGEGVFDLAAGQVRRAVDVPLTLGAVLSGTVLDADTQAALSGVTVDLVDLTNPLHAYTSRTQGSTELRIGPVPPGRYAVLVVPGADNAAYLPTTWAASSGLARDATITLESGQRAQFSVHLTRSTPGPAPAPREQGGGAQGWPGLASGFLAGGQRWPRSGDPLIG